MDFKLWDIQTVTTADFAVQIVINEKVWDKWNFSHVKE
jgi:hypothetical protein